MHTCKYNVGVNRCTIITYKHRIPEIIRQSFKCINKLKFKFIAVQQNLIIRYICKKVLNTVKE